MFLTEEAFGGIVVFTRVMFGRGATPIGAELSYPPPRGLPRTRGCGATPVTFDSERTTLTMPSGFEDRSVLTAKATQFEVALTATRAMLDLDRVDDLVSTIESTLRRNLRLRRTAAQVAGELGMSPRTMHRHLAQVGASFGAIQDRVRRQQADVLLAQTRRPIAAIALDLGYDDPRVFRRAYKRWTGWTPTEARQQLAGP